ncbi:type IV secretory system conjugative DNA transfer family protein, partial [Enterococcus faecium]
DIRYEEEKSRAWYRIEFPKKQANSHDTSLVTKKFKSGKNYSDLEISTLRLKYTDQPTAVFMVIPDYDPSNHVLASIFISQLYTELASNCKQTPDKKCFRRVHFLLDEFGNMPAIDNMDGIMTVCLGRNMLFDLVIQSYSQLETRYDKAFKTIKENCQNHILIMSNDEETIEEISKKCGHKTTINRSASSKHLDTDSSVTSSAEQERVITVERASQLIEGEQIILRNLHRQDTKRNKIRPFPIFNTKETNMPYRYQFLAEDFDTQRDINE